MTALTVVFAALFGAVVGSFGNVVVYRRDNTTHIAAIDAERMLSIVGSSSVTSSVSLVYCT